MAREDYINSLKLDNAELKKKLYLCTPEIPQNSHNSYVSYVDLVNKNYNMEEENQELKKQLEEYKNSQSCSFVNICKSTKIANYYQQKEFVKYLEKESKEVYRDGGLRQNIYKKILEKYKEIIGVSDEKEN